MNATTIKLNVPTDGIYCSTPITGATYNPETHELDITTSPAHLYKTLDEVLDSLVALYKLNPDVDFNWMCDPKYILEERVPRNEDTATDLDQLQEVFDAYSNAVGQELVVVNLVNKVRRIYEQACVCQTLRGLCVASK